MWEPQLPDFLAIADAAYEVHAPEELWFERVFAAARTGMPGVDQGMIGFGKARDGAIEPTRGWATHTEVLDAAMHYSVRQSPEYVRRRYVNHAATDRQLMGDDIVNLTHADWLRAQGASDCFVLNAHDVDGFLVVVGGLLPERAERWATALHEAWDAIALHVLAAARLRSAITRRRARAEAVFRPDGTLLDASGPDAGARDVLRDSVRRIERSRGRWRDRPHASAARTPTIDARWTLVDQFESDGRHFVVAYAADGADEDAGALSPQERRVAEHLAAGWSMKRIAYRLGLSPGTIASYASRACKKLGVRGRVSLGHALRRPSPA